MSSTVLYAHGATVALPASYDRPRPAQPALALEQRSGAAPREGSEPSLLDLWCLLRTELEWLCHLGLGTALAPWDYATRLGYARAVAALRRAVDEARAQGALRRERADAMCAALAAHEAAPEVRATPRERDEAAAQVRAFHERDERLREAFEPPAALRERVFLVAPPRSWPLDAHAAPPWAAVSEGRAPGGARAP